MRQFAGSEGMSELLIAACRRDAADGLRAHSAALGEPAALRPFLDFAQRHGVAGLALASLERSGSLESLPTDQRTSARDSLKRLRLHAAVLLLERDHILSALADEGLRPVVLKGAGLASSVFQEPAERDYGDIDLLLAHGEVDTAIRALGEKGYANPNSADAEQSYRAHHFHIGIQRPGATIVELHWGLVRRIEPFLLDADAFMRRSVQIDQAAAGARFTSATAVPLRLPSAEHALLHIVVECVRGSFSRLKWLVDVDRIVAAAPNMDWDFVVESARLGNLLPSTAFALEMSCDLLGTSVPGAVRRRMRPGRSTRTHLSLLRPPEFMMRQRGRTRSSSADLLQLWLLAGRSRVGWLAKLMTPEADDPMQSLWHDPHSPPAEPVTRVRRVGRVAKLLANQFSTYIEGAASLFSRRRIRARMW